MLFRDGNFDYAITNLILMSKDNRTDGLLSVCFQSAEVLVIPSFLLYYIIAIKDALMLKMTDMRIDAIAKKLSFSYSHHFSAQFKKLMGCKPSLYRTH